MWLCSFLASGSYWITSVTTIGSSSIQPEPAGSYFEARHKGRARYLPNNPVMRFDALEASAVLTQKMQKNVIGVIVTCVGWVCSSRVEGR